MDSDKPTSKHVNLKRGKSEAELKASERSEREKVAPFSFDKPSRKAGSDAPSKGAQGLPFT